MNTYAQCLVEKSEKSVTVARKGKTKEWSFLR